MGKALFVALAVLSVAQIAAQQELDIVGDAPESGYVGGSRRLLDDYNLGKSGKGKKWNFPFSKCIKEGRNSPYILSGPKPVTEGGLLTINFTVVLNPNADKTNKYCYPGLKSEIFKINFRSGVKCAADGVLKEVLVNGEKKTTGVTWKQVAGQDDAVLSLTALRLGKGTLGAKISLVLGAPCNVPKAFTGPRGGKLVYYVTNSSRHECCPVNSWDWGSSWKAGNDAVPGSVTIQTVLPAPYVHEDLHDEATSPVQVPLLEKAAADAWAAAGVSAEVLSTEIQELMMTPPGAHSHFVFTDDVAAQVAAEGLVKGSGQFRKYIATAQVPCGSTITVSTRTGTVGTWSCPSRTGVFLLPSLCADRRERTCYIKPAASAEESSGEESSGEESSGEESSGEESSGEESSASA